MEKRYNYRVAYNIGDQSEHRQGFTMSINTRQVHAKLMNIIPKDVDSFRIIVRVAK